MSRFAIRRRTVLRGKLTGGLGVALALPRLGAMLNGNGTAYADGTPIKPRFLSWFFGNGIEPANWVPAATGTGDAWTLSHSLQPLLEYKPWLSVISGLEVKVPYTQAHKSS